MIDCTEKLNEWMEQLHQIQHAPVNILLVDDRKENLLVLESVLNSQDYHLIRAFSGEEALRAVLHHEIAVILLDVQMPGLDGFDTARLIKARDKSKHIPIIFITAISQAKKNVLQGYSVGAIDYIFKPFDRDMLRMKVDGFVQLFRNQKQIEEQKRLLQRRTDQLESTNIELNRAMNKLRRTETLAKAIGDTSIDTIFTFNEVGHIETINRSVYEMFGYTPDELINCNVSNILHLLNVEGYKKITEIMHTSLAFEKSKLLETIAYHRDGKTFPVEIQIGAEIVDQQKIIVCSIRDITERKMIEEERKQKFIELEQLVEDRTKELKQKTMQIEIILESISDAFYLVDDQWRFTYVNQEAERQIGRKKRI